MAKHPPAFQFYPADFLTGTAHLSLEETGVYIRLLCYQWMHGSLPNNEKILGQICGISRTKFKRIFAKFLSKKFEKCGKNDEFLINSRLEEHRQKQRKFSELQSLRRKGGSGNVDETSESGPTETRPHWSDPSVFSLHTSINSPVETHTPSALNSEQLGNMERVFRQTWNQCNLPGSPLRKLTPTEQNELHSRLNEADFRETFVEVLDLCSRHDFYMGREGNWDGITPGHLFANFEAVERKVRAGRPTKNQGTPNVSNQRSESNIANATAALLEFADELGVGVGEQGDTPGSGTPPLGVHGPAALEVASEDDRFIPD